MNTAGCSASPRVIHGITASLTAFLQTGVRVSELCALRIEDVDLKGKQLTIRSGKGMSARQISLETKGLKALKTWLQLRPNVPHDSVFTNERHGGNH